MTSGVESRADDEEAAGILVVDDVSANCVAIEAALEPLGHRVITVHSGEAALQVLLEREIAVVLLDVSMPILDGYGTASMIRSHPSLRRTPIIFLTAHDRDAAEIRRGYELGVVDYLFKPLDAGVLRAKVQVFVDLQSKIDELRRTRALAQEQELEAERRRVQAESLIEADRRKDEFLAILAHELRNPLAPLRTSIDLLERDPTRFSPRIAQILGRQINHLAHLVDDLLDLSRFTAGKLTLRQDDVIIADVIEDAIAACRPLIDRRRHVLTCSTGVDAKDILVRGDAVRLVQVVSNLINNAAKYTPPGGRIEVHLSALEGNAIITVIDSGRGIPPELIDRVFEMFVQERAGLDGEGGLGLGLALVRRLTELHGGTVSVSSQGTDQGASFTVRLPIAGIDQGRTTQRMKPIVPPALRVLERSLRAVVVDDNEDLRELVAELLTSFGHEVMTAHDGMSGLAMIRDGQPDVALVDIGLPGLDGYEVARALRAETRTRNVRLVAMTGYGSDADLARARDAGFDAHIVKPATVATLLDVLGRRV